MTLIEFIKEYPDEAFARLSSSNIVNKWALSVLSAAGKSIIGNRTRRVMNAKVADIGKV